MTVFELIGELAQYPPDQEIKLDVVGQYIGAETEDGDKTYIVYLETETTNLNVVTRDSRCVLEVEL